MNQIFSPNRFIRYSKYDLSTNKKMLLLLIGGFSVALFIFEIFLFISNNGWRTSNWTGLFFMSYAFTSILLIGNSFNFLRKKESAFRIFLLPVSNFEKFVYEFITKIILFTCLFLILFPVISFLATFTIEYIFGYTKVTTFHFSQIELPKEEYFSNLLFFGIMFSFSLAFSGAVSFKRFPLIKTLVFLGSVAGIGISYIYILFEKLNLDNGVGYVFSKLIKDDDTALIYLFAILAISALTAFTYSFFKLKETEV